MGKKVVALWGISSTGKSETIKKVYETISKLKGAKILYPEPKNGKGTDIITIIEINKIKIGIESQGDPVSRLEKSLKLFVNKKCKIIICATRTKGRTVDYVEDLQPDYKITWIKKDKESNSSKYESVNKAKAKEIIKEIGL